MPPFDSGVRNPKVNSLSGSGEPPIPRAGVSSLRLLQMGAISVLIAVKSKALGRVIQHVLHGQEGISSIDFAHSEQRLTEHAQRLRPGLIIVNSRLLGRAPGRALTELKRANPQSQVILTCDFEEFNRSFDPAIVDGRVLEETLVQQLPAIARRLMSGANASPTRGASAIARSINRQRSHQEMSGSEEPSIKTNRRHTKSSIFPKFSLVLALFTILSLHTRLQADTAPSTYSAYTATDTKLIPPAPSLGSANSVINDPVFGSRILRVTDQKTLGGESFISTDAGFHRAWNADSTAIKLTGPHGDAYWLEFNPNTFKVGDGSSRPVIHSVMFGASWEWSTVDPEVIYFLKGNQIAKYNKSTGVVTSLGGPSTADTLGYMAVVIGLDNWVCAAAGSGQQDSYSKIFCINPISPSTSKFIDVYNKTINGVAQGDPDWPTSAPGKVIGIHDISGGTGASWLEVTFHQQSWRANGGAVFNLATNTWSLVTASDPYWSGHVSMGNGKYANASGSVDGRDSRGLIVRDPNNLMNSSEYLFVAQPPDTRNAWCDADHSSWLNSVNNPNAPILISRYTIGSSCRFAFTGEIDAAAVDGSNTVWRFAHNHNGGSACYYAQSFAQISNDGHWALFSSYWDGALGADTSFGCATRIDTFIVELSHGITTSATPATGGTASSGTTPAQLPIQTSQVQTSVPSPSPVVRYEQTNSAIAYSGAWSTNNLSLHSGGSAALSMDPGSRARFTFVGTGIRWIGYRDEWSGVARVYLDGSLTATVDTFASPAAAQTVLYSVAGLPSASHTLVLEATGARNAKSGGSWVWIDALDVNSSSTSDSVDTTKMQMGYGVIDKGLGVAVLRSFSGQDLVSEAAIPASAAANNWLMYAEKGVGVSTGVAISNPNNIDANVNLLLSDGRQTSLLIPAMGQHSAFVDDLFGNFQGSFLGTLKIQSNTPVAVLTLRGTTNAEGQFIIVSIPLSSSAPDIGGTKVFPSVVDGGGYNSELILVNSASTMSTGSIQFSFEVSTGLGANKTFNFSIPAGGVWRIRTVSGEMGPSGTVTSGYASLIMSGGSPMPDGVAIIRLSSNGNLISETAVSAQSQISRSLMFGSFEPNSRTGVAIVNPLSQDVQVTLTPFDGNGGSVAPAKTLTLSALSQTTAFLDELIGGLPSRFEGSVLLEAASPVYAISVRGTTNSQGGFLMSTLSMVDLNQMPSGVHYFPYVVNGSSYKTEFLMMNTGTSAPQLSLFGTDGKPMAIPLQ